jgi:aspartate/methionine/tyrosine aminotransferase
MTAVSYITNRPTSPAMAAAIEAIERTAREAGERKTRIDADPRIIARREALSALKREYLDGMDGAFLLFADMAAGRLAQRKVWSSLIKARTALLDKNRVAARGYIRDAVFARRQHWTVTKAEPGMFIIQEEPATVRAKLSEEQAA